MLILCFIWSHTKSQTDFQSTNLTINRQINNICMKTLKTIYFHTALNMYKLQQKILNKWKSFWNIKEHIPIAMHSI